MVESMNQPFSKKQAEAALKSVVSAAEDKVGELQSSLREAENRITRLVDEQGREIRKRASLLAGETGLAARRTTEDAKLRIRERPIEAVALGLGIGLVVGAVIGLSLGCYSRPEEDEVYIEE